MYLNERTRYTARLETVRVTSGISVVCDNKFRHCKRIIVKNNVASCLYYERAGKECTTNNVLNI